MLKGLWLPSRLPQLIVAYNHEVLYLARLSCFLFAIVLEKSLTYLIFALRRFCLAS